MTRLLLFFLLSFFSFSSSAWATPGHSIPLADISPPPQLLHRTERVKFGAVLPLTGPGAAIGESDRIGIEIAVARMNDDGGVNGTPLEAVIEDSQSEPRLGLSGFQKLADQDHIPAVIASLTSIVMAIRPESERRGVVMFAESSHPELTKKSAYVFRNFYRTDTANAVLLAHAQSQHLRRIALFHAEEEWGEAARTDLEKRLVEQTPGNPADRLVLVRTESFAKSATDLKPQLLTISKEKPDLLFIIGVGAPVASAYRQIRQLGLRSTVAGFMVCGQTDVFSTAKQDLEGTLAVEAKFDTAGQDYKYLVSELARRYPGRQIDQSTVMAFDAATIIAKALRAGNVGGTEVREFIVGRKRFLGAAGEIRFEDNGDSVRPMELKQIKGGVCVPVTGEDTQ
jgi:branched-chain amino acid transport system substrate-binding protein